MRPSPAAGDVGRFAPRVGDCGTHPRLRRRRRNSIRVLLAWLVLLGQVVGSRATRRRRKSAESSRASCSARPHAVSEHPLSLTSRAPTDELADGDTIESRSACVELEIACRDPYTQHQTLGCTLGCGYLVPHASESSGAAGAASA